MSPGSGPPEAPHAPQREGLHLKERWTEVGWTAVPRKKAASLTAGQAGACVVGPVSTRGAGVQAKARGGERGEWTRYSVPESASIGVRRKQPASRRERCGKHEPVVTGVKGTAGKVKNNRGLYPKVKRPIVSKWEEEDKGKIRVKRVRV